MEDRQHLGTHTEESSLRVSSAVLVNQFDARKLEETKSSIRRLPDTAPSPHLQRSYR